MSPKYCSLAVEDVQELDCALDTEFTPDLKVIAKQPYATLPGIAVTSGDIVSVSGRITVSF